MRLSPLQRAKEKFSGTSAASRAEARKAAKSDLIDAVRAHVKKGELLEDDFSDKGMERVSNRKLLRLLDVIERVQQEFGSRLAMVDAALEAEGRSKDDGYRQRLESFRLPKLLDHCAAALARSRSR
jgi:hypothetical protein